MQHRLKPSSGSTWTKVVAPELFKEFLVAVNDAMTASHMGFGRISRASVCYKDGRLSKSSIRAMGHLLAKGTDILANPRGSLQIARSLIRHHREKFGTSPAEAGHYIAPKAKPKAL